ncbi:MAG TPA: hypothetical protein VLJ44_05865 [Gaiellaceae bacterium]|nr:hypothetical protein [Gaiellaceae bacterium]
MRRRILFLVASAVLTASLAVPSFAAAGNRFSMKLGSTFKVSGRTGSEPGTDTRAVGKVVVAGRWGAGPWRLLTTTSTDSAGYYRLTIKPRRRGDLTLRITPPDHHARRYVLHVS